MITELVGGTSMLGAQGAHGCALLPHMCTGVHTHSLFVWAYTGSVVSTMEHWSAGHSVQHRRHERVPSLSASQEQQHSGAACLVAHRTNVQGLKEHSV